MLVGEGAVLGQGSAGSVGGLYWYGGGAVFVGGRGDAQGQLTSGGSTSRAGGKSHL